ncbi:unnamed protein product [Pleuronectes platessa]|uniref:Uncharacterized protein n=1 Tax=Pleuronectes platessa TaxID=8262 RepID=A0A9N7ZBL0_PLEPL|nr:unnamed protein product [Pleuronectes platessa]
MNQTSLTVATWGETPSTSTRPPSLQCLLLAPYDDDGDIKDKRNDGESEAGGAGGDNERDDDHDLLLLPMTSLSLSQVKTGPADTLAISGGQWGVLAGSNGIEEEFEPQLEDLHCQMSSEVSPCLKMAGEDETGQKDDTEEELRWTEGVDLTCCTGQLEHEGDGGWGQMEKGYSQSGVICAKEQQSLVKDEGWPRP